MFALKTRQGRRGQCGAGGAPPWGVWEETREGQPLLFSHVKAEQGPESQRQDGCSPGGRVPQPDDRHLPRAAGQPDVGLAQSDPRLPVSTAACVCTSVQARAHSHTRVLAATSPGRVGAGRLTS